MTDKKELKRQYKQMKQQMGIFQYHCLPTGKRYIGCSPNVPGKLNSINLQLKWGNCVFKKLQADWNEYGEAQFEIGLLEELEYDQDETKTNYGDDLAALREMYCEELPAGSYEFL